MKDWFTIEQIDESTFSISEYRHWEESHSYLLIGGSYGLLIDTGLGIENIQEQVGRLTNKPIIAVASRYKRLLRCRSKRYFPRTMI